MGLTSMSCEVLKQACIVGRPKWLIADMDETLLAKACRDIKDSPCYPHLVRFLANDERGGDKAEEHRNTQSSKNRLLIVTSDDGHRPFRIWREFPVHLRKQVLLSVSEGASLWRISDRSG